MRRKLVISLVGTAALSLVHTGGQALTVFDPANLTQNYTSAIQSVKAYITQVRQYMEQIRAYEHQVREAVTLGRSVASGSLEKMLDAAGVREVQSLLAAGRGMIDDIKTVETSFKGRIDEIRTSGLSFDSYAKIERRRIAARETAAVKRVQAEQTAMKRIEKDYEFIRTEGAKIGGSESTKSALQLMNVQMNRMLQQNAELQRQLALTMGSQAAEAQMQEAEERARRLTKEEEEELRRKQLADRRSADRSAIESFAPR